MQYKVIKEYKDVPKEPIQIFKGEELAIIKESDPNGDWPNWLYCKGQSKEGWVPKQIMSVNGSTGISNENYNAKEHYLEIGDLLTSDRELNGWIWGYKVNNPKKLGWAPLNCLEKL